MSDEHLNDPEAIDDAIRQAELQLERRIEELRTLAQGDDDGPSGVDVMPVPDSAPTATTDLPEAGSLDAVLRPVGDVRPGDGAFDAPVTVPTDDEAFTPDEPAAEAPETDYPVDGDYGATATLTPTPTTPAGPDVDYTPPSPSSTGGSGDPWQQTRTALRLLEDATTSLRNDLPGEVARTVGDTLSRDLPKRLGHQVGTTVTDLLERVVRDELAPHTSTVRHMQQQLPQFADRVEKVASDEGSATRSAVEQLRADMPELVERLDTSIRSQGDRAQDGLQHSVERLERSIDGGIDKSTHKLGRTLDEVRGHIVTSVADVVRDESGASRATMRDLYEQKLVPPLGSIAEASKVSLDKLSGIAADIDHDRMQRAEDVELLVDTMTTGWKGISTALSGVFDRLDEVDKRIGDVEHRLHRLVDIEASVNDGLVAIRRQVDDALSRVQHSLDSLQPAPVLVTVKHPSAEVTQETRGGYTDGS